MFEVFDGLSLLVHDERKDICGLVWGTARSGACNGLEFGDVNCKLMICNVLG